MFNTWPVRRGPVLHQAQCALGSISTCGSGPFLPVPLCTKPIVNLVPPRGLCHCCCCCRSRVTPPPADAFKRPSTGPTTTSRSLPRLATAGFSFRSVDYFLYTPTGQSALGYLIWCKHMPVVLKTEVRFGC